MKYLHWKNWIIWINKSITLVWLLHCASPVSAKRHSDIPTFTDTPLTVNVSVGNETEMKCGVNNLGTKTVGWRKLPYNVPITVGKDQFLELERFKLVRVLHKGEWNLHIKNSQTFDSGIYECQVSSKGNFIRRNVTLNVYEKNTTPFKPTIYLTGTQFVEKGNPIHLVCNASGGAEDPPQSADWYKDGRKIETSYAQSISITRRVSILEGTLISVLDIDNARMSDTGVYVCRASKNLTTRIKVDVLNAGTYNFKRNTNDGTDEDKASESLVLHDNSHDSINGCQSVKLQRSYTMTLTLFIVGYIINLLNNCVNRHFVFHYLGVL